ncbi:MAG: ECF-type sigma factor [Phycisphaerales bacterium JB038]
MGSTASDATGIVQRLQDGEHQAADELLEHVYDELRRQATLQLRRAHARTSLQPTALVHEAYLKLIDQSQVDWQGKTHFCAVAAIAMRRLVINDARRLLTLKRGGDRARVTLHDGNLGCDADEVDLLALQEALEKLRQLDETQANIVELRFFGGLTIPEVAYYLDLAPRTVDGEWAMARAWLRRELVDEGA